MQSHIEGLTLNASINMTKKYCSPYLANLNMMSQISSLVENKGVHKNGRAKYSSKVNLGPCKTTLMSELFRENS